ncbi:MAG: hypothetical protein JXA09_16005 [Anaerolineae bacterium]|nr:hypothetical protein [Anaerolineae bacterium]
MSRSSRALLGIAIVVHLGMLVSWRTGWLNPLFFDATVTHGRRGWDFYALYQAGHNVLAGDSAYESDGTQIEVVIPGGAYTPFRYLPLSAYTLGVALNLVSPLWAYRLWVAFVELVLLACIALTWRVVPEPDRRARLTAMWLCFTPYYLELYIGQFSLVQGALVYVTLLAAMRPALSRWLGPSWIASVLWKQNTALFGPTMARLGRWRALGVLCALLLLTTGPYFALVPGSLAAFARNFVSEPPWFQLGNLGFRQLVFDTMWSIGDLLGAQIPDAAYAGAQTAVLLVALGLPLALTLFDHQPDVVAQLGLWMSAYYLAYHHVWEHHYVMLLPVLVALIIQDESPWTWAVYLLLALPTPFYLIDPRGQVAVLDAMRWTPIRPLWQDLAYHASKALPALLLYVLLALRIARPIVASWRVGRFYLWPLRTRAIAPLADGAEGGR